MRTRPLLVSLAILLALVAVPAFASGPASSASAAGDHPAAKPSPRLPANRVYGACYLICSYPEGGGVVYDPTMTWTQCCITNSPTCPPGTTQERLFWDDGYQSYEC